MVWVTSSHFGGLRVRLAEWVGDPLYGEDSPACSEMVALLWSRALSATVRKSLQRRSCLGRPVVFFWLCHFLAL